MSETKDFRPESQKLHVEKTLGGLSLGSLIAALTGRKQPTTQVEAQNLVTKDKAAAEDVVRRIIEKLKRLDE